MAKLQNHKPYREGRHQTFVSSEKKCTHIANNPDRNMVRQFRVDGDLVPKTSPESRCDFLLLNDDKENAYYIELKGGDIGKAIDQIECTIQKFHNEISSYQIHRHIVYSSSNTHAIKSDKVTRWRKKHGKTAIIERHRLPVTI